MSQITIDSFVYGTNSIAKEKPTYKIGHDGSDGSCDSLGLIRGGLLRSGATKIKFMKEPNQFARKTATKLRKRDRDVRRGDILLKTKDKDDNTNPLPSRYCFGGSDFNGDTTNYVDVALVVREKPVEILYMTKEGVTKSSDLSEWGYMCELPYVLYSEVKKTMKSASVHSKDGSSVKLFKNSSFSSECIANIPSDTMVVITESGTPWTRVSYGDKSGYVLTNLIKSVELDNNMKISQADRSELEKAYEILGRVLGYIK